ncbi:hypothetical protein SCB49_00550 [unidentified eubacterium SCB49]|nr:hypothetical protein SCB49_00550 [unidentified eubacterium SCB49]
MEARFKSFKHDNSFYLSKRNSIAVILLLIFLLLFCIYSLTKLKIGVWVSFSAFLLVAYTTIINFFNLFSTEKPRGTYNRDLVLSQNHITIHKSTFKISEINKIEFSLYDDRKGKFKHHNTYFEPSISHGLNNRLILHLKKGKKVTTSFLQEKNRSLKQHPEVLIHYHKMGILHWLQLIDILEITDYDKIQKFKKQINAVD